MLHDIEKGNHNYGQCEHYCKKYKDVFSQELPECQFKGNKSKIQNLIQKVHINADRSVTEVQFRNETPNDEDFKITIAENQQIDGTGEEHVVQIGQSDTKYSKKNNTKSEQTSSLLTKMKNISLTLLILLVVFLTLLTPLILFASLILQNINSTN